MRVLDGSLKTTLSYNDSSKYRTTTGLQMVLDDAFHTRSNGGTLMKAHVEQIEVMSETLESAGFSNEKSNAIIKSVALAMETFAVTPEMLDERIERVIEVVRAQGVDIRELKHSFARLERSMLRFMMVFTVMMLATLLGGFGTLIGLFLGADS